MSHVWPDILVRGVRDAMVVRTRQITKDARPANVLVYNGEQVDTCALRLHVSCKIRSDKATLLCMYTPTFACMIVNKGSVLLPQLYTLSTANCPECLAPRNLFTE